MINENPLSTSADEVIAMSDLPPGVPENLEMQYWKDSAGQVYAYPKDPLHRGPVKEGLNPMSEAEVHAHLNPVLLPWTDGSALRYAVGEVELPGWRRATEDEVAVLVRARQVADAQAQVVTLRLRVDAAIAPLQDAFDLDEASAGEIALLRDWKRYRVSLSRLAEQAGYPETIDWPMPPA